MIDAEFQEDGPKPSMARLLGLIWSGGQSWRRNREPQRIGPEVGKEDAAKPSMLRLVEWLRRYPDEAQPSEPHA